MTTLLEFPYSWEPLRLPAMLAFQRILDSWEFTPYMPGAQGRGMGVDCVRWVAAVLDEMLGIKTALPSLPQDSAFHSRERAEVGMRKILRIYSPCSVVEKGCAVRPGDIVIVGCSGGGPGHSLIVGYKKNTLWQSDHGTGVVRGGFGLIDTYQVLYRVYRVENLEQRWLP